MMPKAIMLGKRSILLAGFSVICCYSVWASLSALSFFLHDSHPRILFSTEDVNTLQKSNSTFASLAESSLLQDNVHVTLNTNAHNILIETKNESEVTTTPLKPTKKKQFYTLNVNRIVYFSTNEKATQITEQWLTNLGRFPFEKAPVTQFENSTGIDWLATYTNLAASLINNLSTEQQNNEGDILIIHDDYQLLNMSRVEDAIRSVTSKTDILRLDCFLEGRILRIRHEYQDNMSTVSLSPTIGSGGLHAMVWASDRLHKIADYLQTVSLNKPRVSMEWALSQKLDKKTGIKIKCLTVSEWSAFGCFHDWKLSEEDISVETSQRISEWPTLEESSATKNLPIIHDHHFDWSGQDVKYRTIDIGEKASKHIPLLVGVCSQNIKFERRQAIRKTWAEKKDVYFVVAGNFTLIEKEFHAFQDLIWVDVAEDYKFGLTPKTLSWVHFANTIAPEFSLKTDDDMYFNLTSLEHRLLSNSGERIDYYGMSTGTEVIRNINSKWYLSREEYPEDNFPAYGSGGGYVLSRMFASCAVAQFATLHRMYWEDVAIGLAARECNVSLTSAIEWDGSVMAEQTSFFHSNPSKVDLLHGVSVENQFRIHNGLKMEFDERWEKNSWRFECPDPSKVS